MEPGITLPDDFDEERLSVAFPTYDDLAIAILTRERLSRPGIISGFHTAPRMALKFAPFGSEIELPFYTALSQSKIDYDKLDDSARPVLGLYEPRVTHAPDESCKMQILGNALSSDE